MAENRIIRRLGTLGDALSRQAAERPEKVALLTVPDGEQLSYREWDTLSMNCAASLSARGVGQGDTVGVMLPNCLEFPVVWFGLARLGAVMASMNPDLRSDALRHQVVSSRCRAMVVRADTLAGLGGAAMLFKDVETLVVVGSGAPSSINGTETVSLEAVLAEHGDGFAAPEVSEFDPTMFLSTSGTTGLPKPCVLSHHWVMNQALIQREQLLLTDGDVIYTPLPNYHTHGAGHLLGSAVAVGGTAAIGRKFSASRYWDEIRTSGATIFDFIGTTLALVWKQPRRDEDRDHHVRFGWGEPIPEWGAEFEERFGVRLLEAYGLTQTGSCIYDSLDEPHRPGSCGRGLPSYEFKIVDKHDDVAATGEVGELLIRGAEPGVMFDGYFGMPDETAKAKNGGWFRSGDLMSVDADGWYYFHGRVHDSIRRRGEFVSAFEVEQTLVGHQLILDAAVVGVPDDVSGEEVKACIVPRDGCEIQWTRLVAYCQERLAAAAVPRYFELWESLPKSPTGKIQKQDLRSTGVSQRTWDRRAGS
jgi:crotonobetaine/carnitine-CoA ligase